MEPELKIDLEAEKKAIITKYRYLLRIAKLKKGDPDQLLIRKALDIAMEAHKDVRRKSGEPYIYHPLEVARIVAQDIGLGTTSIVCALLHDVVEDSNMTIEDIQVLFGEKVANIIDGLTKLDHAFDQNAETSLQAENFRKVILTIADDVRVIIIKIADRLHNMRTLDSMRRDKQLKIASETLYIYAPLAHRLGLYNIKSELEDLSLKYKSPNIYNSIESKLKKTQAVRTRFVNQFSMPIKRAIDSMGLRYEIKGRTKSVYSIWNKMRTKNIPFEEVFDLFAVRIILESDGDLEKPNCWRVYSVITDFYRPNPDRLRDWISTPKANGYESLHTTVMSPSGKWVEVQIRSRRMDDVAEKGLAAHWKYKDDKSQESALDAWINKVREHLESSASNAVDFVDDFKLNLFAKEIFVFTPKGDVKSLPHRSTVLDFAFEIHTQLGKHCIGGKVNGKLMPISYELKSGDQIQIITSKANLPDPDWLNFVVSAKAKAGLKNVLKEERKKHARAGRKKLSENLEKAGLIADEANFKSLVSFYKAKNQQDLFYRAATEHLDLARIETLEHNQGKLLYTPAKNNKSKTLEELLKTFRGNKNDSVLLGSNLKKLNYRLATCCNPIPGDDVVGFVTSTGDIAIHRTNCPNTLKLISNYAFRIVKAKWDKEESISFLSGIRMTGFDRRGLINEMTRIISNDMHTNMRSITFDTNDGIFEGTIMVYVNDTVHLHDLMSKLRAITGIDRVDRISKAN